MNDDAGWVPGDALGLPFPAHSDALLEQGPNFLTRAFHASNALEADNRVTRISDYKEFSAGSTGRKALLRVDYEHATALPVDLFVKFSRDFADPFRDRGRFQMEFEVRFALLSQTPEFPISVPTCLFADYHRESGTGLLISERIAFGSNAIERQYEKCMDFSMPDQFEHYRAIVTALARLAGTAQAGGLPTDISTAFPAGMQSLSVGERVPYTSEQLARRVSGLLDFVASNPELLPANIRSDAFLTRFAEVVGGFIAHEERIWTYLESNTEFVALCHWNANVDNAWFWRSAEKNGAGRLQCGLLDWGCVGQMNVAMAIWGAMCSAEVPMWDRHLDELLRLFADEFHACGGADLDLAVFERQVLLYAGMMGVTWLLDVPRFLSTQLPPHVPSRYDPRVQDDEAVRSRLLMLTNFLNLFQTRDLGRVLESFVSQ